MLHSLEADADLASQLALEIGAFVVNSFRFISVLGAALHEDTRRYCSDIVQINLAGAPCDHWHDSVRREVETGEVSLASGPDQHRQPLQLGQAGLDSMIEHHHLERLWRIGGIKERSDFEDAILDAVEWIGDAQSEARPGPALLKYWAALEVLTTGSSEQEIQRRLCDYIPIFVGQFEGLPRPSKNQVRRLYDHRSDVIHGRLPGPTARTDLHTVAYWAVLCTSFALELHARGYSTRAEVEAQSARLAKLYKGKS